MSRKKTEGWYEDDAFASFFLDWTSESSDDESMPRRDAPDDEVVRRNLDPGLEPDALDQLTFYSGIQQPTSHFDVPDSFSDWLDSDPWGSGPVEFTLPVLAELKQRSMDGSDNNDLHADWGAAGSAFIRLTPSQYQDGISEAEAPRANYRALSNDVIKQDGSIPNSAEVSDLFTFFGQFIDHDIDIALEGTEEGPHVVAPNDDLYVFQGKTLGIDRSAPYGGTGSSETNPREHANAITSFVDASNVYGSTDATMADLRDSDSPWLMKMSGNADLLPLGAGPHGQFEAGDIRAGENSALTAVHTIWAKEHNRLAEVLKSKHPDWSEDDVFNAAKITVESLIQHITFDEWLPLLVGENNIPDYWGYDPHMDPSISHEFASAAFRFGHSLLSSDIKRMDENGDNAGDLQLARMFFNAAVLKDAGSVDTLVRGLAAQSAQELDHHLVEDVRSLLFPGPDGIQVRDLSVLNNLRGLDHGLGTLNEVRDALGYERYDDFSDLTQDANLATALRQHYDSVDDVDLWIGGLLEQPVHGSQLGETFQHIVLDQFMRLRDGDSYYFEERLNDFPELLAEIKDTSFSDIIKRNTDIEYLQDDAFIAHARVGGDDDDNNLVGSDNHDLMIGFAGKDVLKGKDGDDDIYAGADNDKVWGGKGDDLIVGEGGNDQLSGGRGRDMFVFEQGSGRDKVLDFDVRKDTLDISDYDVRSMWEVRDLAEQSEKGVRITLNEDTNDQVTLIGVKVRELSESNFVFNDDDALTG
ncbi:MAG: hypothetical protein JXQ99_23250 [Hyphomicrobiaceae bacterium]